MIPFIILHICFSLNSLIFLLIKNIFLLFFLIILIIFFDNVIYLSFSAGAGRSGTYIAFDNLLHEKKETKKIDAMKAVLKMRENRQDMVQNEVSLIQLPKNTNSALLFAMISYCTNVKNLSKLITDCYCYHNNMISFGQSYFYF